MYFSFYDSSLFFFNDTATTEIYTLSLHDALPISETPWPVACAPLRRRPGSRSRRRRSAQAGDRKSTRLNSSHQIISYAVFCLKKKKHANDYQRRSSIFLYILLLPPLLVFGC